MILYIQTAFLGDLLLSVPALKRLRKIYPDQEIHLLCRKGLGDFFVKEQLVDKVIDGFKGQKPSVLEARRLLSENTYQLLICPHQSFRSSLIASVIKAKNKIGFKSFNNKFIFDSTLQRPMNLPEALRQLSLLKGEDKELEQLFKTVENKKAPFDEIPEWSSMEQKRYTEHFSYRERLVKKYSLGASQRIFLIAPGSVWPTKRWSVEKYMELAQMAQRRGAQVLLIGSPAEKDITKKIANQVAGVLDLAGTTSIDQLIDIIAGADVLISNDSGAMHMASIAGTPTVALFGPTVLSFGYQPWNKRAKVIENSKLNCRPCSSHGGKRCPIGTHECMTSISAQLVLSNVDALLQKSI
jgi:heptosyltransferase II